MSEGKRIVIVGGVAGGASAAARARRLAENAKIVLFERGADISFANCGMPYHVGGVIPDRGRLLVQTPQSMWRRYRIEVRTLTEVLRIEREKKEVLVRDLKSGQETTEPYDALILSPGAEPVRPPIPGLEGKGVFTLRSLADMDAIRKAVEANASGTEGKMPSGRAGGTPAIREGETPSPRQPSPRALIIGGGYIGLEMAEALRAKGLAVTMVELAEQVFGIIDPEMAEPVHEHLRAKGVELRLGTSVKSVRREGELLRAALSDGGELACGLVIVAVGIRPEARLAREAGLAIGPAGGIVVDEHMRTSDPAIFAVGDAVEPPDFVSGRRAVVPLAGPASRQGRIAADNALGRDSVYRKSLGTAICKVFDLAVGAVGLSEKALKRGWVPYEKVYVHPASHAGYYPGASPITLKLLFDPVGGKVLGAQAVGAEGVDKRIDVLAVAIRAGMTVFGLEDLELAYAPPYGSARDPVNYAGYVASNVLRGDVKLCHAEDAMNPRPDQFLLDVRTPGEVAAGTIPGAVNIPVDELRARLGELPRDKEILAFCRVGQRAYVACRILGQSGFRCRDLSGGYLTYAAAAKATRGEGERGEGVPGTAAAPAADGSPSIVRGCREDAANHGTPPSPLPEPLPKEFVVKEIDCTHMQCPGPILRLHDEMASLSEGQGLAMVSADPGFPPDVQGWCRSTGNRLAELKALEGNRFRAVIVKRGTSADAPVGSSSARVAEATAPETTIAEMAKVKTMVVFSGDLDRAMASFMIANGAAAMGSKVTMFFTFWGLNILRRPGRPRVSGKTLIEKMFGWMMPRGANKLKLSQMNMGGLGTAMMKGRMKSRNVPSLTELIQSARKAGVKLVACAMSLDVMGLKKEELIDGIEFGGVASFLSEAQQGNVTLFI